MRSSVRQLSPVIYLATSAALIALLEVFVLAFEIPEYLVPRPSQVLAHLSTYLPIYWQNTLTTLHEVALGFLFGWLVAFVFAILVLIPNLGPLLRPVLVVSQTFPVQAVAPLIIIWFGTGVLPKIITSALLVFFPVAQGLIDGFTRIPPSHIELFQTLKARPWQTFLHIRVPHALPTALTATRVGITLSVIGAIIGEFITAQSGLGLQIRQGASELNQLQSFSALFILGFIGVTLYSVIDLTETLILMRFRRAVFW